MASLFDDILLKGIKSGQMPARSEEAKKWFRTKAREVGRVSESTILKDSRERLKDRSAIGRMYFFVYDAKHKATLPYYDKFPLIFPVDKTSDGFFGLNFHYLPLPLRAKLMDSLYDITNNKKYDETTKLKLSYGILKGAQKFSLFKPTFKRYLNSQVRSRFVEVAPAEWDIALFLGSDQFTGATRNQVWRDSKEIMRKK